MRKTCKKSAGLLLCGFSLLLLLFLKPVQAEAQENQAGKSLLCPEDEIVLVNFGGGKAQVFDSAGNDCGFTNKYLEYCDALTESREGIFLEREPEKLIIRNGFQGPVLREVPIQDLDWRVSGDYCLLWNSETPFLELLHCSGKVLYSSNDPQVIRDGHFAIHGFEEGVLFLCRTYGESSPDTRMVMLFSADGTVSKKIEDTDIADDLISYMGISRAFGKGLITGNKDSFRYYSWKALNGEEEFLPLSATASSRGRGREWKYVLAAGLPDEKGICKVYDTDLSVTGTISYSTNKDLEKLGYCGGLWRGGFFEGNEYEELEGKRCDSVISWGFLEETAVSCEGNLVRIASPDGCIHVTVGENEVVEAANRNYAVIRGEEHDENYEYDYRVVHLPEEKEIWRGHCREWHRYFSAEGVSLNEDCCMIQKGYMEEAIIQVFNAEGERTCVIRRSSASLWPNDLILLHRGAYVGFADIYGDWICRTTKEKM